MALSRSEAAMGTDMDTGGAITVVAAIITVGAAVVTMAGTEAITTVGGIITAIGGDVLNQCERPHLMCGLSLSSDRGMSRRAWSTTA